MSRLGREKQKQFLRYFNHMLEQAIHLRVYQQGDSSRIPDSIMPGNELDLAERLNKIAAMDQQEAIIKELTGPAIILKEMRMGKCCSMPLQSSYTIFCRIGWSLKAKPCVLSQNMYIWILES